MSGKEGTHFSQLQIYQRYEELSELLWNVVDCWDRMLQDRLGSQMLRAVDSIGANIAEAIGRAHFKESLHHLYYARGSLLETQHWIRVAVRRKLIDKTQTQQLREIALVLQRQLNAFIRVQRPKNSSPSTKTNTVEDAPTPYGKLPKPTTPDFLNPLANPSPKSRAKLKSQSPELRAQSPNHV